MSLTASEQRPTAEGAQQPTAIRKSALWAKAKDLVLRELKKEIDYGRTIRYDDLVLSIKGGENKGIFI